MKNENPYPLNRFILRFRETDTEKAFSEAAFPYDLQAFRTIIAGLILINTGMIFVDQVRIDDLNAPLIYRGLLSLFLVMVIFLTFFIKSNRTRNLQALIAFTITFITASYFFMASRLTLPDYFLPNAIISVIFFTVVISGLRFKYTLLLIPVIYIFFIIFSTSLIPNALWSSQIINVTVNIMIALMAGYLYENSRRKVFVKNTMMNTQKEELEFLNELKNKMFSLLSHDLRGPINKLITMIDLARDEKITQEEYIRYTEQIQHELKYTSSYMNNLLLWTKSMIGGERGVKKQVKIAEVVSRTIEAFEPDIRKKKLNVSHHIPSGSVIEFEEDSLHMSLRNLLSNAIKYTPEAGSINIEGKPNGKYFELCIKDNGTGIDPETKKDLFHFSMNSANGTGGETGTGVGLYLLREFLERSGGRISFRDNEGQGSIFCIRFPLNVRQGAIG